MKETLLGIFGFIAFFLIASFILGGAVGIIEVVGLFLANTASPYLAIALWVLLPVVFVILIPLSFIKPLKVMTGNLIFASSYFFGLIAWVFGFVSTYYTWGTTALIIGLLLGGIVVVPIGFLAALINGELLALLMIFLGVIVTYGTRWISLKILDEA